MYSCKSVYVFLSVERRWSNRCSHCSTNLVSAKPELMSEVGIILADVGDLASLATMCKQGVVVLNCVGPYRFYGEPVVKACIENGTHYMDICGEPQFLEGMQLKYQSQAAENGVYVIGSCGFDSIPADMGIQFTRDHFKGTLTAVESFLTISTGPEVGNTNQL
ncbi:saccharopine dehydrogenase-like oxidoreductase isoform X3 [Anguilla rostrata]|uniref:saccharopine dehydrogenase-like oxidoreductase isoform X3 n=1 Tax=Anguilla rostrata TaxID=7938 RepID=UPI0030D29A3F